MTFWDFLHLNFGAVSVLIIVVLFMIGGYKLITKELL